MTKTGQTEAKLTWADLVALEPRLADLLQEARSCRRRKGWCANAKWYGYGKHFGAGLKGRLIHLVGWEGAGPWVAASPADAAPRESIEVRTLVFHKH